MGAAMQLANAAAQAEIVRDTVLLTGAPRSGTTLTGKIMATLKGLEYRFEPPGFYALCAAHAAGQLDRETAAQLVQVYLSEDHLLEAAHGRGLNMRERDDSHYRNQIGEDELQRRWQEVGNRADALTLVRRDRLRLAVKMPNVMDAHGMLCTAMPGMKTVLVQRDGCDVVRSIVAKRWVSDEGLQSDLWPYRSPVGTVPVPYWVPDRWAGEWAALTELARACIMWSVHADLALELGGQPDVIPCRYEALVSDPASVIGALSARLEAPETGLTRRRIAEIRTDRTGGGPLSDTSALPGEILNWFLDVNGRSGY